MPPDVDRDGPDVPGVDLGRVAGEVQALLADADARLAADRYEEAADRLAAGLLAIERARAAVLRARRPGASPGGRPRG